MAASRTVALVNLKLAAIKQAIEDLARAQAIRDYAVQHKRNARVVVGFQSFAVDALAE